MKDIIKVVGDVETYLMIKIPFIGSLLYRARIVASNIPVIAGTDRNSVIHINPDKFLKLDFNVQCSALAHEVLHAAFRHAHRMEYVEYKELFNIAADVIVNEILIDEHFEIPDEWWIARDLSKIVNPLEIEKWSVERLYIELMKHSIVVELKSSNDLIPPHDGVIISEGSPDVYEDPEEGWKEAVSVAYELAKSAGNVPAGLIREIEYLLKPKISWRRLLRASLIGGTTKHISTWKKPSRKHKDFPGYYQRGTRVIALIDTSASISEEELRGFLSEIYGASRLSKVKVRCWDAEVYEELTVKRPSDVHSILPKLKGGGGTVISNALKQTLKDMRYGDTVVVLTDGHLFDEDEAQTLFREVASRAERAIIVSSDKKVNAPGWIHIFSGGDMHG